MRTDPIDQPTCRACSGKVRDMMSGAEPVRRVHHDGLD
jgi:hypothetical protein